MEDKNKKIAAMTAVLYYLQAEVEADWIDTAPDKPAPAAPDGYWSFSGRQSQMMLRSMAQMRLFPGWKG